MRDTPCTLQDPDIWFSETEADVTLAKSLCQGCWFKDQCKVLGKNEGYGIWGGEEAKNTISEEPSVKYCRKGLHVKQGKGTCIECRRASQRSYEKTSKRHYKKPYVRQELGDYCANDHLLTSGNTSIRSGDEALICLTCVGIARAGWNQNKNRAYAMVGDYN